MESKPCEEGVECCYSRQTKFWIEDPDGTLWEIYTLAPDSEPPGPAAAGCGPSAGPVRLQPIEQLAAPAIWTHRLGEPFPPRVMVESDGVDEVFLQGTFNAAAFHRRAPARSSRSLPHSAAARW